MLFLLNNYTCFIMTIRFFSSLQYTLLIAIFLAGVKAFAEEDAHKSFKLRADSLKNILNTQTLTEKQQLELYSKITSAYASFAIDSVIVYAPKALKLAQKLRNKEFEIANSSHLGVAYAFRNNLDSAFLYLDRMEELAIQLKSKLDEATALGHKAFACALHENYLSAIDYYIKALTILDGVNNSDKDKEANEYYNNQFYIRHITVLANLGELNRRLNNTDMAIQYLDKAAEISAEKYGLGGWGITQIYNEYATVFLKQGDLDKALEYALKSDSINYDIITTKFDTKVLLAKIYLQKGDYERALHHAQEAMEQVEILKSKNMYVTAWTIFSDIYLAQKRYPEAEIEALKAWQTDSTNIDDARAIAFNLASANIHTHNTEKADYYLKKYADLNVQYSEKSFQTTISDLSIKYETDKKEMRIASLEQQKIWYISISLTGILLAVALWIIFRQKLQQEQKEKQLAVANAILKWEKEERKQFASNIHDGVSGMLSAIKLELAAIEPLQEIRNKLDECIETIRRIARGMMPVSLEKYGLKAALEDYCRLFSNVRFYFFGENKRIDEKIELTIYYCAYELVNNAFKHANAENINVQLVQDNNRLSLTIQDDGCGFDMESFVQGAGMKSVNDRVAAINGKLDINASPGNGAEITIELGIRN